MSSCANHEIASAPSQQTITSLSIRYATPKYVEGRRLSALISSQAGTTYSEEKLDADIRKLYESGFVDDVRFSLKKEQNALHLIATIYTRPGFGSVLFRGNTSFPDYTLFKQLSRSVAARIQKAITREFDPVTDKRIIYKDEHLISEVLPVACNELERFYRGRGIRDAKVLAKSWNGGKPTHDDFGFVIIERAGNGMTLSKQKSVDAKARSPVVRATSTAPTHHLYRLAVVSGVLRASR